MSAKSFSEFEIKVALGTLESANDLLQSLRCSGTQSDEDVYFDTISRQLFQKGCFLRLRNSKVFEIKYNADATNLSHLICEEHKFSWPLSTSSKKSIGRFLNTLLNSGESVLEKDLFAIFQLSEFIRIAKHRTIYHGDGIEVSLDRVNGLGLFLEVEARGRNGIEKATAFCSSRGLKNLPLGYVELWLRKYDFSAYRTGKYLLEGDSITGLNPNPKEAHAPRYITPI